MLARPAMVTEAARLDPGAVRSYYTMPMDDLRPHDGVDHIVPYVPSWSKLPGVAQTCKLASNESALGPSPSAMEAAIDALEKAHVYPDPRSRDLREALAGHFGVETKKLFCGAGSEDIIRLLACAYATPGDDVLHTQHGFLAYPISTRVAGANPVVAAEKDMRVDVDAVLDAVTPACKVVFIANPGNPTGTYIARDELKRLRADLPRRVLLVIDSAYAEFVSEKDYEPGWEMVDQGEDNTVMLRTFSKAYGLAALRVGWAYASANVINVLDKVRNQFNVSGPGQAAAIAALADKEHLRKTLEANHTNKAWLEERLRGFGFELSESVANFVLARCPDGVDACTRLNQYLREHGVSVKPGDISGLPDCLRITIGPRAALEQLVARLEDYFASAEVPPDE